MTDQNTPARTAAEQIWDYITSRFPVAECIKDCQKCPEDEKAGCRLGEIGQLADIIEQSFAETNRTLLQAAKWAEMKGDCPYTIGECMHSEDCAPVYEEFTKEYCWIEYWKKEAAPCET